MEKRVPNLYLENAEILPGSFRNFAGRQTQYNKQGDRNFNIVIDEKTAEQLLRDGWNVRQMKPRDENAPDEPPRYMLNVKVWFRELRGLPPTKVYLYSGRKRTLLDEETIDTLDYAEYRTADLTIRPRYWTDERTGKRGIKAYLQEMRVTIEPDRWAEKYAHYDEEAENDESGDLPF